MFSLEINGYNKEEVEEKILALEEEVVALELACKEKDDINFKLAGAVDKAKEIHSTSQNLFKLKIQKLAIIYQTFAQNFTALLKKYPTLKNITSLRDIFDKFSRDAKDVLKDEYQTNITSPVRTENDTIRLLLNKMSAYAKPKSDDIKTGSIKRNAKFDIEKQKNDYVSKTQKKSAKTIISQSNENFIASGLEISIKNSENKSQIKPITNLTSSNGEQLCDVFLKSNEDFENNAYAKMLSKRPASELFPTPNESGFDLKEAVNPKEDLSEIMKAFNFHD